jgi:hypothetical protein
MRLVFAHIAVTAALAIAATAALMTLSAAATGRNRPRPCPRIPRLPTPHTASPSPPRIAECAHAKNPAAHGSGPGEIVIVVRP